MEVTECDNRPIAILGGGYVGRALGAALCARGYRVHATTTTAQRLPELAAAGLLPRLLHVSDQSGLAALAAECAVIYLTLAPSRRDQAYRDVYLAAAENLAGVLPHTRVRRAIYTSSTSVYAQDDGSWVDETSPTEPATENGRVLLETEHVLLTRLPAEVDVSVVRLGGIHGPGRALDEIAARCAGQERADGDAFINLVHLDDIVAALVGLLEVEHHGVLNLTGDQPTTRRALYDALLHARGLPPVNWISNAEAGLGKRVRSERIQQLLELRWQHALFAPEPQI